MSTTSIATITDDHHRHATPRARRAGLAALVAGALASVALATTAARAEEPVELVRRSLAVHRLKDEMEKRTMRIVSASGDAKERELTLWSMTTDKGTAKTLARFTSPRDVEGTAILTWEGEAGAAGDQWMFLPLSLIHI